MNTQNITRKCSENKRDIENSWKVRAARGILTLDELKEEHERLETKYWRLMGENNALRSAVGLPLKYEHGEDEIEPVGEETELIELKQKPIPKRRCMIFDIKTKKRIV